MPPQRVTDGHALHPFPIETYFPIEALGDWGDT